MASLLEMASLLDVLMCSEYASLIQKILCIFETELNIIKSINSNAT